MRDILAYLVGGSIKLAFGAVSSAITSPKPRYEELLKAYKEYEKLLEEAKESVAKKGAESVTSSESERGKSKEEERQKIVQEILVRCSYNPECIRRAAQKVREKRERGEEISIEELTGKVF